MENINRMTELLERQAQDKAAELLATGKRQAQGIHKESLLQGQKRRNEILEEYKRRTQALRERGRSELRNEAGHLELAARQRMVDLTLRAVEERFNNRSETEEMDLLVRVYRQSVKRADGEEPTVLVPENRVAAAQAAVGPEVQVAAGDFTKGFVLSFRYFNVNYENQALLRFRREELEALAAAQLFGGEDEKAEA